MNIHQEGSISEQAAIIASLSRTDLDKDESCREALVEGVKSLLGSVTPMQAQDPADVLALVTFAHGLVRTLIEVARQEYQDDGEPDPILHFSGRIDQAMKAAIDGLENLTGLSSEPYAWGEPRVQQ
jgi:hypothetical protein